MKLLFYITNFYIEGEHTFNNCKIYFHIVYTEWRTNVIPLIVHITHFYFFTKALDIWYRINPHRLENCS